MQIRLANRQDEPTIRSLVSQRRESSGKSDLDLTGSDSDLSNIESHYFWYDGIFIVAETDGVIGGFAGARRGKSEDTLELLRFICVGTDQAIAAGRLLETTMFFGRNMDYKQIVCPKSDSDVDIHLCQSLSLGFEGPEPLHLNLGNHQ